MFKKIYLHRALIGLVYYHLIKQKVLKLLLTDKIYLNKVVISNDIEYPQNLVLPLQPNQRLIRQIDSIINKLNPAAGCLSRCLVKRDILMKNGIETSVCFGLLKEDNNLIAHAWLSIEKNVGYAKVYQTS